MTHVSNSEVKFLTLLALCFLRLSLILDARCWLRKAWLVEIMALLDMWPVCEAVSSSETGTAPASGNLGFLVPFLER